jgi:hypothetical protein
MRTLIAGLLGILGLWAGGHVARHKPPQPTKAEIRMCRTHLWALHGDVTGDGQPDTVRVIGSSNASGVCRLSLHVAFGGRRIRTAVVGPSDAGVDPGNAAFELVRLNRSRGLAIVVAPWQDGVSDFARLYVVHGDRLRNLRAPRPVSWDGMFLFSGSMAGGGGVDCAAHGLIEAAEAGPFGPKPYTGVRRYLTLRGARLAVVPRLTVRRRLRGNANFRGLTSSPFPSCTVAKSGRFS